jgi:hypothetical protein
MNARGGIASVFLDNLLCVEIENNPSKGTFFENPQNALSSAGTLTRLPVYFSFRLSM